MAVLCSIGSGRNSGRSPVSALSPPANSGGPFFAVELDDCFAKPSAGTSTNFSSPSPSSWLRAIPLWAKPMPKLSETICRSSAELGCCRQHEVEDLALKPFPLRAWKLRALIVISLPLLGVLLVYRILVSPLKSIIFGSSARCRFTPSCSAYAYEAIQIHGPFSGVWLGIKRLIRCQPWGGTGHDPVPRRINGSNQLSTPH